MKVYDVAAGEPRLIGRADVPDDAGPVFEVKLFGAASVIRESYTVGTVTHTPMGSPLTVERAVLLSAGQILDFLPGWVPLSG